MEKSSEEKNLVKYDSQYLEKIQRLGMTRVDPLDIRPPSMLLVQKSSDLSQLLDKQSNQAKVGQFYHTGQLKIEDSFECYFVFAAKNKYTDKRKPEEGEKDQYKAIGVLKSDLSLFGMTFKSSSLYTLSPLFSASASQKKPMFSFSCKMETKKLTGEQGDWFIPVLRITGDITDNLLLNALEQIARGLDSKADSVIQEEE